MAKPGLSECFKVVNALNLNVRNRHRFVVSGVNLDHGSRQLLDCQMPWIIGSHVVQNLRAPSVTRHVSAMGQFNGINVLNAKGNVGRRIGGMVPQHHHGSVGEPDIATMRPLSAPKRRQQRVGLIEKTARSHENGGICNEPIGIVIGPR
jgi:hypothetical protein